MCNIGTFRAFIALNVFVSVSTDFTDLSASTTPATTTSASPPVSPPVRSTSVSPPQTPPAASLSVPSVLVIVLGVVLLLLLVPLLILIQQNRVMRRGRRDPETVILCLIQCVISQCVVNWQQVCLSTLTALSKRRHRTTTEAFMRRFSTKIDTVSSLRGVSKCHSVEFCGVNRIITLRGTSGIITLICGTFCVVWNYIVLSVEWSKGSGGLANLQLWMYLMVSTP